MIDEDAAIMINGIIIPEFNHLNNLIFLYITRDIFPKDLIYNLKI